MTYVIIGDQEEKKEAAIALLKKEYLLDGNARKLDYEVLYADKLNPDILKKSLLSLPAVAAARFLILRTAHKLSARNKDILLQHIAQDLSHLVLVLESNTLKRTDSFLKKVALQAKIQEFFSGEKTNVFDMTRAMGARRPTEALMLLAGLYSEGTHPLQIMGGLTWFWRKHQTRLSKERYEKGLRYLQEADLNIKRSRLDPEYAVEVAVVKLTDLC